MSDSQTVTIPAAEHAATADTRPARLLRALAQHPEPLSTPVLAGLLAEPGRRRRLLASYDRALHRHEQAGHVERAGRVPKRRGRPAIIWRITPAGRGWLDEHDNAPALAAAEAAEAQRQTEQAQRAATKRDQALDEARATFNRQTPRISRNAPPTSYEISAAPSTRSARSSTSAKKESARTFSGNPQHANPRESRSRVRASPPGKRSCSSTCTKATPRKTIRRTPTHSGR